MQIYKQNLGNSKSLYIKPRNMWCVILGMFGMINFRYWYTGKIMPILLVHRLLVPVVREENTLKWILKKIDFEKW